MSDPKIITLDEFSKTVLDPALIDLADHVYGLREGCLITSSELTPEWREAKLTEMRAKALVKEIEYKIRKAKKL